MFLESTDPRTELQIRAQCQNYGNHWYFHHHLGTTDKDPLVEFFSGWGGVNRVGGAV
jgi:hypothetical protein